MLFHLSWFPPPTSLLHRIHPPAATLRAMSDDAQVPWSNDPNAPPIPYLLYQAEKYNFAGILLTAAFYGELTHAFVYPDSICRSIYHSRDRDRSVFPMYGRVAQSAQPHEGGHQVGPHNAHDNHVLVCDDIHRDDPPHPIHLLHK